MSRTTRRTRRWSNEAVSLRNSYPRSSTVAADGISSPAAKNVTAQPSIAERFTFSLQSVPSGSSSRPGTRTHSGGQRLRQQAVTEDLGSKHDPILPRKSLSDVGIGG